MSRHALCPPFALTSFLFRTLLFACLCCSAGELVSQCLSGASACLHQLPESFAVLGTVGVCTADYSHLYSFQVSVAAS